jgi:transposase
MSFIRYKKFGNKEYAYEVTSYWDPEKKKPRQKTKYLGVVVDKENKIFRKKRKERKEKLILDFGDVYFLNQFISRTKLFEMFEDKKEKLLTLIFYRLCYPSAMRYARIWYEGSLAKVLFDADVSSQRISEFLEEIGDEGIQREFFAEYIKKISPEEGLIIDTTASNQINIPHNVWGWHNEEIDKQIKLLLVIDRKTSLPLFFRYMPGSIVDVSSLKTTIDELRKHGVTKNFIILDAGFFSEDNIRELYREEIPFLIRLPALRKLYKRLVVEESREIESYRNAVRYGKRVLFIKKREVELFGNKAYAYIVLDPERKGREIRRTLLKVMDEVSKEDEEQMEYILMKKGIMILVSSLDVDREEVVSLYYTRQIAERLFGFSKDDLNILPLRVHKEETLRGYLFLHFASLVVYSLLKRELGKDYTVEEVLLTLRNLKCKVYEDEVVVQELTKQQREIFERFGIMVPKSMGI